MKDRLYLFAGHESPLPTSCERAPPPRNVQRQNSSIFQWDMIRLFGFG